MKLTKDMGAALELLSDTGDRALVRAWSEWWVPDASTAAARRLGPPHYDTTGRIQAGPAYVLWDGAEQITMVRTATVKALVARSLMKFTGGKRRVLSSVSRTDYWRAEITPAGLAFRAVQVEAAAEAAARILREIVHES